MEHAIDRAARIIGSQAALAAALGVTRAAIPQWKDQGRRVPAEHCPVIERLTDGQVTCEQLRPDIEWSVLRNAPAASLIVRGDGTVTEDERHPEHDPAFVKEKLAAEGPCALDPETPLASPRHRRTDPPLAGYERGGVPQ